MRDIEARLSWFRIPQSRSLQVAILFAFFILILDMARHMASEIFIWGTACLVGGIVREYFIAKNDNRGESDKMRSFCTGAAVATVALPLSGVRHFGVVSTTSFFGGLAFIVLETAFSDGFSKRSKEAKIRQVISLVEM